MDNLGDIPASSRWQYFFGVIAGVSFDALFQQLGFLALIKLRLIVVTDAFEGWYSDERLQRIEIWAVFVTVALGFLLLTRYRRYSRFAWTALGCHCVAGGIYSAAMSLLVNF